MTHAPTTLHEHFRADPRGASGYPQWIEDRIWELLQRPAQVHYRGDEDEWTVSNIHRMTWIPLHEAITDCVIRWSEPEGKRGFQDMRVVLLNGTIIREWAADGGATTDRSSMQADQVDE